jgi:succinoglycan biosynthesis transport protein ExoP
MTPNNLNPGNALQPAPRNPVGGPLARSLPPSPVASNLGDYMDPSFGAGDEISVRSIAVMLRKRKWIIVATTLVVVAAAAIISYRTTPVYEAAGRVLIGRETPLVVGKNQEISSDDYDDYTVKLETEMQVLRSDAVAQQVIREMHLDAPFAPPQRDPNQPRSAVVEANPAQQAAALGAFHGNLRVALIPRTRIVELRYDSTDPKQAAAVVNRTMGAYIEQNYRAKLNSASETSDWLSKELVELQAKVEMSQQKLVTYQREHNIVGLDDKQNITLSKLDQINHALTEAEADRIQKESIYRMVKSGNISVISGANGMLEKLRGRQIELQDEMAKDSVVYGANHPKVKEAQSQLDQIAEQIKTETTKIISHTEGEYLAAAQREKLLRDVMEKQKQEANNLNQAAIEFSLLKRDADSSRQLYEGLLEKLKEAGVTAGLKSGSIRIIDYAQVPLGPSKPQTRRNIMMSVGLGLLAGILLVFLAEAIDNRIHTPEQAQMVAMLPMLGLIPAQPALGISARKRLPSIAGNGAETSAVVLSSPKSEPAEAYRALRTCIQLSPVERRPHVMVVCSGLAREGKTTTAVNTAIVLAQQGSSVLLVDADMRRAAVHKHLGMRLKADGLSSLLAGQVEIGAVLQMHPQIPNLKLIFAGPTPPHPAELLGSERMHELIRRWRTEYDYVVLDTPPALAVTDAVILSATADAVILVARADSTPRSALRRARDLFAQINAPILGMVLNAVNFNSPDYYQTYYYGSRYTDYRGYVDDSDSEAAAAGK